MNMCHSWMPLRQGAIVIDGVDLKAWGENLHKRIRKSVGMPVSVGIGSTKTLAKMATHFAKKYPGYRHCCMIDNEEKRIKALKLFPIDDVWGIGRRYAAKLETLGVMIIRKNTLWKKVRVLIAISPCTYPRKYVYLSP